MIIGVGGVWRPWSVLLRHMVWHPTEVSFAVVGEATALRLTEPDGTVTLASIGGPVSGARRHEGGWR